MKKRIAVKRKSLRKAASKNSNENDVLSRKRSNPSQGASSSKKQKTNLKTEKLPCLRTRMSPTGLYDFLNKGLSEQQLLSIKELGFGSLLQLKTNRVPGQLAYWLVSNFDPYNCSLLNGKLSIEEIDFHLALGIPMGQHSVIEASFADKSELFISVLNEWKSQFNSDKIIETTDILEKMKEQKEGGDNFKRNFIVYLVSCFLGGVRGSQPTLKILKSLHNVDNVSNLNWCQYTKIKLVENVILWQKKLGNPDNAKEFLFKGPILPLVFIYLDRCIFKIPLVSRSFPTMASWSKDIISFRVKDEQKLTNTFGRGYIVDRLVIDRSSDGKTLNHEPCSVDGVSTCAEKLVEAAKKLYHCFENFKFVAHDAVIQNSHSSILKVALYADDERLGEALSGLNEAVQIISSSNNEANVSVSAERAEEFLDDVDMKNSTEIVDKEIDDVVVTKISTGKAVEEDHDTFETRNSSEKVVDDEVDLKDKEEPDEDAEVIESVLECSNNEDKEEQEGAEFVSNSLDQEQEERSDSDIQDQNDEEMHSNTDAEDTSLHEDVPSSLFDSVSAVEEEVTKTLLRMNGGNEAVEKDSSRKNITLSALRACNSSTTKGCESNAPTAKFEGFDITSDLVPTLQKIWRNHGNIIENSTIRSGDIICRALESLASMVQILENNPVQLLSDHQAEYLSTTISDLKIMGFKVHWLDSFVEKAVKLQKSKALVDSLNKVGQLVSQVKERRTILLDKVAKLTSEENKLKKEMVKVSKAIPFSGEVKFDEPLGSGLT